MHMEIVRASPAFPTKSLTVVSTPDSEARAFLARIRKDVRKRTLRDKAGQTYLRLELFAHGRCARIVLGRYDMTDAKHPYNVLSSRGLLLLLCKFYREGDPIPSEVADIFTEAEILALAAFAGR
jgi:hypothetical protein